MHNLFFPALPQPISATTTAEDNEIPGSFHAWDDYILD